MSPPNPDTARSCALCGKPQMPEFRPFCSKRCADIDLGRWLKGTYIIPGRATDEGDQPAGPPANENGDDPG